MLENLTSFEVDNKTGEVLHVAVGSPWVVYPVGEHIILQGDKVEIRDGKAYAIISDYERWQRLRLAADAITREYGKALEITQPDHILQAPIVAHPAP